MVDHKSGPATIQLRISKNGFLSTMAAWDFAFRVLRTHLTPSYVAHVHARFAVSVPDVLRGSDPLQSAGTSPWMMDVCIAADGH